MVADAIFRLRTLGLCQDNDNDDVLITTEYIIENIIDVHSTDVGPRTWTYNIGKLNLDVLRKEQQQDQFCKNKVNEMKKLDPTFLLDDNSVLRKVVKLQYTIERTIVVLRRWTSLIIVEFHNAKGHQGISHTINMMRHYFWSIGMWRDVHQHINSCKLCIQFLPNRLYTPHAFGNAPSTIGWLCHGLYWTPANIFKGL